MNKKDTPRNPGYRAVLGFSLWEIFYGDKSNWYTEHAGRKDWSKKNVKLFWEAVRVEKIANGDYDFSEFIFPEFARDHLWKQEEERIFDGDVNFFKAHFLEHVNFINTQFSGEARFCHTQFSGGAEFVDAQFLNTADFQDAQFLEEVIFAEVIFSEEVDFTWAKFSGEVNFPEVIFSEEVSFRDATFSEGADFGDATFSGRAIFEDVKFSKQVSFISAKFSGEANFNLAKFSGVAYFSEARFVDAYFTSTQFFEEVDFESVEFSKRVDFERAFFFAEANFSSLKIMSAEFESTSFPQEERTLFQEWEIQDCVTFIDVIFPYTVQFQRCDMKKVEFKSCDFVKVNFSNSKFHIRKNRLVLLNDQDNSHGDVSDMYRQLKRNRMDAKDWTNAGDAYRSEMVMKRKQIKEDIKAGHRSKWVNWCVMGLYDWLSGYQQSIGRPLGWLFGLLLVVPMVLVLVDPGHDIFKAFEKSFTAALPMAGKLDYDGYPDWCFFLLLFERVFSITLLTFFALATRARLRQ